MFAYLIRRFFALIPIVIGVMLLTFVLFRFIGGNPAFRIAGKGSSPLRIAEISHQNGYDKPKIFGFWAEEMVQESRAPHVTVTKKGDQKIFIYKPEPSRALRSLSAPHAAPQTLYRVTAQLSAPRGGVVRLLRQFSGVENQARHLLLEKKLEPGTHEVSAQEKLPFPDAVGSDAGPDQAPPRLDVTFHVEFEGEEAVISTVSVHEERGNGQWALTAQNAEPLVFKRKPGKTRLAFAVLDPDYEQRYRLTFKIQTPQGGAVRVHRRFEGVADTERVLVAEKQLNAAATAIGLAAETISPQQEKAPEVLTLDAVPSRLGVNFEIEFEGEEATVSSVEAYRRQRNPFDAQLWQMMWKLMRFDFGISKETRQRVATMILNGIGPSLAISVPAFFLNLLLTLSLSLVCAYYRNSLLDRALVVAAVMGMSLNFVIICILVQNWAGTEATLFGIPLGLQNYGLPVWGFEGPRYLILPLAIVLLTGIGGGLRFYRTIMLNERYADHVRTALAKGCSESSVMFKHVLKNAMIPILTNVVVAILFLYTGQLLLENFFGIPGIGYLTVQAIQNGDEPVLFASVFIGSILFVVANLLTDISYALVDPRVRLR